MGISELWNIIEKQKIESITTPEDEASQAKEEHDRSGGRPFRHMIIGVDTPVVMSQCTAGTYGANKFNGMAPLEIFFYKLCHLAQSWCSVVFVFDGPSRPRVKRGREIPVDNEPGWYGPCQNLIKRFGFHVHTAPGEAEAELAELDARGLIDIVLTGDSDVFVFGARSVLRSATVRHNQHSGHSSSDIFSLYHVTRLQEKEPAAFARGGFLLMALLLGGDYAEGVKGCGPVTAFDLARCGYGEHLLAACSSQSGHSRRQAIADILATMRAELCSNAQGRLRQRNHTAVAYLTEELFATNEVIDFYINPATSFSQGHGVNSSAWATINELDTAEIARMACEQLGSNFRQYDNMIKKFYSNVWPAGLKRILLSHDILIQPDEGSLETSRSRVTILTIKERQERRTKFKSIVSPWFRITFLTEPLRWTLTEALKMLNMKPPRTSQVATGNMSEISIWVPAVFVPPLVKAMGAGRKIPKHRPSTRAPGSLLRALDSVLAKDHAVDPVAGRGEASLVSDANRSLSSSSFASPFLEPAVAPAPREFIDLTTAGDEEPNYSREGAQAGPSTARFTGENMSGDSCDYSSDSSNISFPSVHTIVASSLRARCNSGVGVESSTLGPHEVSGSAAFHSLGVIEFTDSGEELSEPTCGTNVIDLTDSGDNGEQVYISDN